MESLILAHPSHPARTVTHLRFCVHELGLHSLSFTKHSYCTKSLLPLKCINHSKIIFTLDLALKLFLIKKYFYISFLCVEMMLPNASVDGTSCLWPIQSLESSLLCVPVPIRNLNVLPASCHSMLSQLFMLHSSL